MQLEHFLGDVHADYAMFKRIVCLVQCEQPSGSSITGTCAQIASIANDSEARAILEWDGTADVLDIRDPCLLFYLRWAE